MSMIQQGLIFGPETDHSESDWKVPEPSDLPYLTGVTRLSMDSETSSKNPFTCDLVGVSIGYRTDSLDLKSLYAPVGHISGNMDPDVVRAWLNHVIAGKEVVFANAKFDIPVFKRFGVDLEALGVKAHDVAFPDALIDDNRMAGRSLDELGHRYVGRGKVEFTGDMSRMAQYPSWMVGPYGQGDAEITLEVDECTVEPIKKENLERVLALENSIIYAVCELERNGCRLDVEKLELWRRQVRDHYESIIKELHSMTGLLIQPGQGESIARLFAQLGIDPLKVRPEKKHKKGKRKGESEPEEKKKKTGPPVYTEDELVALKHPVINKVVEARWADSLLSKFLDKYHDGLVGDTIRAQYHQLKNDEGGTVSGRFSSSGGGDLKTGYGFNAQQVIKTKLQQATLGDRWIVRELFTPRDGQQFFSADASQIEYRLYAHFAKAKRILEAYRNDPNADYHFLMMQQIALFKAGFDDRTITKNVNFGRMYGAGDEQIAATAGVSVASAQEIIAFADKATPEAKDLMQRLSYEAETKGFVQTLFGRRCRFGAHEKRYYASVNRVIQGSAADVFKVALKAVYDERHTLGITCLRQVVHDEIDGDKHPDELYTKRIQEFLNEQRVELSVPIIWSLQTGANWKECH